VDKETKSTYEKALLSQENYVVRNHSEVTSLRMLFHGNIPDLHFCHWQW